MALGLRIAKIKKFGLKHIITLRREMQQRCMIPNVS
jgi:hypothetical protein